VQATVGTTAVRLALPPNATPVVQNLGPGTLYFDTGNDVTVATGIRLPVGAVFEFVRDLSAVGGDLWLIADAANTNVRYLAVG
jgi:hypothetical protein